MLFQASSSLKAMAVQVAVSSKERNQKVIQAEKWLEIAMYHHSLRCLGKQFDYQEALKHFVYVAHQADDRVARAWGLYRIGEILIHGFGLEKDYTQALAFFEKAAEQTDNLMVQALAWTQIGRIHGSGLGIPANKAKAANYYMRAVKQQHCNMARDIALERLRQGSREIII
jgi:tetratricopeptide (TPR) repeat protein